MSLQVISIRITRKQIDKLDELVKEGYFSSRAEAIRAAVEDLLQRTASNKKIAENIRENHVVT